MLRRDETTFVLVDTAGLRRKRKQRQGIEYYSELRALEAAERADVALVLVDASQGVVDQDLAVADVARKAQCATIVVLSKWDVTEIRLEDVRPQIATRLRQRPPLIADLRSHGAWARAAPRTRSRPSSCRIAGRIPTAELNRALQELREARQPPGRRGRRLNLLYGTQVTLAPAALPVLRERPQPRHARLRLLGRERAARTLRARGRARLHRLRHVRMRIVVVGAGSWGTAFACLLRDNGHEVTLAARDPEQVAAMAATGRNPRYAQAADLSGIAPRRSPTRPSRTPSSSSSPFRAACSARSFAAFPATRRSSASPRGSIPATGARLSTLVRNRPVAVLSGPNIADEIVRGLPAAAVVASDDLELAVRLQVAVHSVLFRVYVSDDVVGVELCAAAKNVIALAAGGRRRPLARATTRRRRSSRAGLRRCGGSPSRPARDPTPSPVSQGWATSSSRAGRRPGRNRRAGELIARGATPDEAAAEIGMVVEGLTTAPVLRDLARRLEIELPITEGVCAVLEGHR